MKYVIMIALALATPFCMNITVAAPFVEDTDSTAIVDNYIKNCFTNNTTGMVTLEFAFVDEMNQTPHLWEYFFKTSNKYSNITDLQVQFVDVQNENFPSPEQEVGISAILRAAPSSDTIKSVTFITR